MNSAIPTVSAFISLALMVALSLFDPPPTLAQAQGCDAVVRALKATGVAPRVTIDMKKGTVQVESRQGACIEPISIWVKRDWSKMESAAGTQQPPPGSQPSESRGPTPKPPPKRAPETVPNPTPKPELNPTPKLAPRPAPGKVTCNLNVKDFWRPGLFVIGGKQYWLVGVFTIDLDSDTRTDNLGFRFESQDGSKVILRYFAVQGKPSASEIRGLKLADESIIPRFCFGGTKFDKLVKIGKTGARPFELPNLAEQAKSEPTAKGDEKKEEPDGVSWFALIGGALLLMFLAGGVAYWIRERRKDEEDVYGDEEDDGGEEGKKKGG